MKRKRDSVGCDTKVGNREAEDFVDPETQPLGPSFADLPSSITTNILLRLPIKSVLICKCVCTSWRTIISDPHFAKLHFKRTPYDVLIRTNDPKRVSRTLHLLEFEPEKIDSLNFVSDDVYTGSCLCKDHPKPNCNRHMKLGALTFKLPLRNAKMVLDKMLEAKAGGRKKSYIACKPRDDKFAVVNSCNGLLCLCDPKVRNPLVVCNPITGEFIKLPETPKVEKLAEIFDCGFGFHKETNEYKVVRVYKQYVRYPTKAREWLYNGRVAEMHTLGTGTWKTVGGVQNILGRLKYPTSLDGAIHWLRTDFFGKEEPIMSFNFKSERFHEFPSPPCLFSDYGFRSTEYITMGELNGCLFICSKFPTCPVVLWIMEKYGVGESWTKLFSFDAFYKSSDPWPWGSYWPIKLFNDGAGVLMYKSRNWLIYHDRRNYESKLFTVSGDYFKFEAIAHIPSLISLKDAIKGDDVEVLSVYSRCRTFKLREENDVLLLTEEIEGSLCCEYPSDHEPSDYDEEYS